MASIRWTTTHKTICTEPYAVVARVYISGDYTVEPVAYAAFDKHFGAAGAAVTLADGRKGWILSKYGEASGVYKTRRAAMQAVAA